LCSGCHQNCEKQCRRQQTSIFNVLCHGLLYIQWFEVRNDCWFCRYWWNCWPSLLKLSSDSKMFILIFYGSLIVKTSHFLLFTPRRPRKTRNIYILKCANLIEIRLCMSMHHLSYTLTCNLRDQCADTGSLFPGHEKF
jgi:hypothetical protein